MSRLSDTVGAWTEGFGGGWNRFWYTPSDPYPLGLMRLCVGLLALYFQLSYMPDLVRFFGDDGLLTPQLTEQWNVSAGGFNPGQYSYLSRLHTPAQLYTAHAIGTGILVLMTIGLFSRVTTVLGLVVVLSYIQRAPMLATHLESVLAMLMFYLCFGPTGASWSVDRWWMRRRAAGPAPVAHWERPRYSATVALRLIQIHLALAYAMMALAKIRGISMVTSDLGMEWQDSWGAGTAVWLLIARPDSPWIDLTWLRNHPFIINGWTHAIVIFELLFPVLIWNRLTRPLMLTVAALMWGSLALISGIAPFSIAMLIGNMAYFPAETLRALTGGLPLAAPSAPPRLAGA